VVSVTKAPFLSRITGEPVASLPLTPEQQAAIDEFKAMLRSGLYAEEALPCVCGLSPSDVVIGKRDRYGIAIQTLICMGCGVMRSDPYLSKESLERFYAAHYRRIYIGKGATPESLYERQVHHGERIWQCVTSWGGGSPATVFEIGCGAGGVLGYARDRGARVAGSDFGEEGIAEGRERGLDLRIGSIAALADAGKADLVVLSHVLEHVRDPVAFLRDASRLLSDQGVLYIELPGIFSIRFSYRDPLLFLQNAHAWHFCLDSLDLVHSMAGCRRIVGNEEIRALYRLDSSIEAITPDRTLYRRVLRGLWIADLTRRWPGISLKKMLAHGGRRVLGNTIYERVKRGIG
jgi:SAM-dependent methyltransferase